MKCRWVVFALYVLAVGVVSLRDPGRVARSLLAVPGMDKISHGILYLGLGGLGRWTFQSEMFQNRAGWILSSLAGYGVLLELLQGLLTGGSRRFESGDIIANTIGVVAGWAGQTFWADRRRRGRTV